MLDKTKGALFGALVGDALGVPYEFKSPDRLPMRLEIDMEPPAYFPRSWPGVPVGTWSDDGALILALMESLTISHHLTPGYMDSQELDFDLDDFARRALDFYRNGAYCVDNVRFDVGNQTRYSLEEYEAGTPPERSGWSGWQDNGNGSLMRVLPVAMLVCSDVESISMACKQSLVTHGHELSQFCCALYTLIAKRLMIGFTIADALESGTESFLQLFSTHIEAVKMVKERFKGGGSGYVVDSLWSALDCLENTESYEECVVEAVLLGNDTDTTACIAGGLAGMAYGYSGIPQRWLDQLRWWDFAQSILDKFIDTHREFYDRGTV